ncbi:MAG: hypothetical protein AAGE52_21150, partial [Myxococcota bacterium]
MRTLLLVLAMGCAARPSPDVQSHDESERATADEIAAGWIIEGDWLLSERRVVEATRVGALVLTGVPAEMPPLEARAWVDDAALNGWEALTPTWSEEDHHVATLELPGVATEVQLRVRADALELLQQL